MGKQEGQLLNEALFEAAERGELATVEALLKRGAEAQPIDMDALSAAASKGHDQCVRALLPYCEVSSNDGESLRLALIDGHFSCVKMLSEELSLELDTKVFKKKCIEYVSSALIHGRHDPLLLTSYANSIEFLLKAAAPIPKEEQELLLLISRSVNYQRNQGRESLIKSFMEKEQIAQFMEPVSHSLAEPDSEFSSATRPVKRASL